MSKRKIGPARARSKRDTPGAPTARTPSPEPHHPDWITTAGATPKGPARLLWVLLAALVVARGIAAFAPGMGAWGLDLLRFTAAPVWIVWGLAVAALAPAISMPIVRWLERAAMRAGSIGQWKALPWAIVPATLVWLMPDRVLLVGDSLLREMTGHTGRSVFASLYPQGLPMDAFLHDTLVRVLAPALGSSPGEIARLLGAGEAALLGVLAFRFTRVLDLGGVIAVAAGSVVCVGGMLALFTGYNKAFAEMVLLCVAIGVFGLEAARRGTGLLPLGLALAVGFSLHRLALGFVPAAIVAWVLAWRFRDPDSRGHGVAVRVAAAAIPLATLAVFAPRLWSLATRFDAGGNFLSPEVRRQGGPIAAAFAPLQLADVINVILLLSPLAPAILAASLIRWTPERRREAAVLGALILPLAAFAPFFHPPQGVFRDWDAFAATAMALSIGAAWTIAVILVERPQARWLAIAVVLGAAAPTLAWLAHHTSPERGFARVEAYLAGPPPRTDLATASDWDYLGIRYGDHGRLDAAATAFERAAEIAPSPKTLSAWAVTELARGNLAKSQELYRRVAEGTPKKPEAWLDLARVSLQRGDSVETRRAAQRVLELRPGDARAREILERTSRGVRE